VVDLPPHLVSPFLGGEGDRVYRRHTGGSPHLFGGYMGERLKRLEGRKRKRRKKRTG